LAFQPRIVEVEKLVASGSVGLWGMQLQLLEGLDGGVEARSAEARRGREPAPDLPP
jgi:hypothetical protein